MWPEYTRGTGERDPLIRKLLLKLFGSESHVESLLELRSDGMEPRLGVTLLHLAAAHDLPVICEWICGEIGNSPVWDSFGFEISRRNSAKRDCYGTIYSRDGCGETPLHVAARNGHTAIVNLFIAEGVDVNTKSSTGEYLSPLHLAVVKGHNDVVQTLIEHGADLECTGRYWKETPLLITSYVGRVTTVELLLWADANVHATIEGFGETVIMCALHSLNPLPVIKLLLCAGAKINKRDRQGRSALHYALDLLPLGQCKEVMEFLIGNGADVNVPCVVTGDTVLHTAAIFDLQERQFRYSQQLREEEPWKPSMDSLNEREHCDVTINIVDERDKDEKDLVDVVELLLVSGANLEIMNHWGDTALGCSIKSRNAAVSYILLWSLGLEVDFTMDSIGDQGFLDRIKQEVLKDIAQ